MEQQQPSMQGSPQSAFPPSSSKSNISLIIGGILLLVLVAGASYFLGTKAQRRNISEAPISLMPTSSLPKSLSPTIQEPSSQNDEIIIKNSGSTNSPGWTLTIYPDGSGSLKYNYSKLHPKNNSEYSIGTYSNVVTNIQSIGDVSTIHTANDCMKSASFGTATWIQYKGKNSGDLECMQKDLPAIEKELLKELSL